MSKKRALALLPFTLVVLGCAASPIERLGGAEAIVSRFREIHTQVYGVYGLGLDRDAIHARLAEAFAGDALTDEYVEHWTTLARMRQEGTAIDVLAVDYENVSIAGVEPGGVLVEADWSVGGIVTHQRHKHQRVNRYQAIYTVALAANEDGEEPTLHIVDTRMRSAERVANPIDATSGFPLDSLPTSERGFLGPAEMLKSGLLDDAAPAQPPGASALTPNAPASASTPDTPDE